MRSYMRNGYDCFLNLKMQILPLVSLLEMLKEDMIVMLTTSGLVLESVSLDESFLKLQQVLTVSSEDLELLIRQVELVEKENFFSAEDLQDEFEYVHESIYLELDYTNHISDYILSLNQPIFHKRRGKEKYLNQEKRYLEQIESNHQQLKQLRKEGRENYFE